MKDRFQNNTGGFSFVEVMITLALFLLLAGVGMGAYFQYYSFSLKNHDVNESINLLQKARFKALKNATSTDYGVHIDTGMNMITGFEPPYNPNDPQNVTVELKELTIMDLNIQPSIGVTEDIIFEATTGKTMNTGTFTLGTNDYSYTFTINAQGVIE